MTQGQAAGPVSRFVEVGGCRLEYVELPAVVQDRPSLVFLHEGLGCVGMWRSFPNLVAARTGCRTVVYSRRGYGGSDPAAGPRTVDYLHEEALEVLPGLRRALGLDRVVLVGHSDGASIALIHAGAGWWPVDGVVVMAPHEFVEDITLAGIAAAVSDWSAGDRVSRLGRSHRDPEWVFRAWADTWLSPAFRDWNIESYLQGIRCPVLAVQGEDDGFATMAQLDAIAVKAVAAPRVEQLRLAGCGHSPHRDREAVVVDAITRFVSRLGRSRQSGGGEDR